MWVGAFAPRIAGGTAPTAVAGRKDVKRKWFDGDTSRTSNLLPSRLRATLFPPHLEQRGDAASRTRPSTKRGPPPPQCYSRLWLPHPLPRMSTRGFFGQAREPAGAKLGVDNARRHAEPAARSPRHAWPLTIMPRVTPSALDEGRARRPYRRCTNSATNNIDCPSIHDCIRRQ